MPLQRCETDGKPGWRWGDAPSARCYPYTPGNEESEKAARKKALAQAAAMGEFPGTGVENRAEQGNITTPDAGDLNTDARRYCAQRGWAMSDGSYPIRPLDMHGRTDLMKAIRAVGRGSGSHAAIRAHIIKRARALGLMDMIPDDWTGGGESRSASETSPVGPVEFRGANITDVDFAQRRIDIVAAPYDQPSQVPVLYRGELWDEIFERGAFEGIETRQGRISANRDHDRSRTVGKVTQLWPSREEGLVAEVKIGKTVLGDETLALADEDMVSGSVGFGLRGRDQVLNKQTMTRRIKRAFVDHLAFVEKPAYAGAQVLSVRSGDGEIVSAADLPPLAAPAVDEYVAFLAALRRR